jgi:hypothetical protein
MRALPEATMGVSALKVHREAVLSYTDQTHGLAPIPPSGLNIRRSR